MTFPSLDASRQAPAPAKLTTRETFEALAPPALQAHAGRLFAKDGRLKARAPRGESGALWALLLMDLAPARGVGPVVRARVTFPDLSTEAVAWLDSPRGKAWVTLSLFTEGCGRWQAPTSRMLEAWPSQTRQREVFARIVEKYNA